MQGPPFIDNAGHTVYCAEKSASVSPAAPSGAADDGAEQAAAASGSAVDVSQRI